MTQLKPPPGPPPTIHLGWAVATLERGTLTLLQSRDTTTEPIIPTQEVNVSGALNLRALADLLAPYATRAEDLTRFEAALMKIATAPNTEAGVDLIAIAHRAIAPHLYPEEGAARG